MNETAARRGTTIAQEVEDADVVVTSYTLARLEGEQWKDVRLGGVIIDEAQAVKNPRTATYRVLRDLEAPWKLAVSGTPIENSLSDLWSLLSLTCPGLLPPWESFQQRVRKPIENGADPALLARLTAYVSPFVLRRTKEEVAPDLPDKIVDIVRVDLGKEHRHIYDQYLARERARILDLLRDVDANRMSVLASCRWAIRRSCLASSPHSWNVFATCWSVVESPSYSLMDRRVVALMSSSSSARGAPRSSLSHSRLAARA